MNKKIPEPPSKLSGGDIVKSAAIAASGVVPFLGPAVSELINVVVTAPAQQRLTDWLTMVADTINLLHEKNEGLNPENLAQNDAFLTAVIATTRSAMLTARKEKLAILEAVLWQVGNSTTLDAVLQDTFLSMVDRYTPEHVLMLKRLANKFELETAFKRISMKNPSDMNAESSVQIEKLAPYVFSEVPTEVAEAIFEDLHRDRLCNGSEGWTYDVHIESLSRVVTERGRKFLGFVTFGTDEVN